jgi:uncharacterized membrane protein required for colicin V production
MSPDKLPFNVFDLVLAVVLVLGITRGRKHGMSEELLGMLKWLAVLFVCSLVYEPGGRLLAQCIPLSMLACFVIVYVGVALLILGIFGLLKHSLGSKLVGSDFFGHAEYYLGMGSGMVRFTCILLAGLALLNARLFTSQEVKARERQQNEDYGSNFFPGLPNVQSTVFEKSLAGPWIKQNLSFLLIKPTRPENKELHQRDAKLPY